MLRRVIDAVPGAGLVDVLPRTATFAVRSWRRGRRVHTYPDIPAAGLSPRLLAEVALDETLLALMRTQGGGLRREDLERAGAEMAEAHRLFSARGWIDDPSSYHRPPPPIDRLDDDVTSVRRRPVRTLSWSSGYEPWPDEPGAERWTSVDANDTARALVVEPARPSSSWLVCLHGFGMGQPMVDLHVFDAHLVAEQLGVNVMTVVLPMHGSRGRTLLSGTDFMSYELMNPVFGLTQAVWDVRRILGWLRSEQGARKVALHGISLGGYTAALLAGLEDGLDAVVAGIPPSDFPQLFRHHSSRPVRRRAVEAGVLGEASHEVHQVVSPLAFSPRLDRGGRVIYAALGDRMSTPEQAQRLWEHWGRPRIEWLGGAHAASPVSPAVRGLVADALRDADMTNVTAAP